MKEKQKPAAEHVHERADTLGCPVKATVHCQILYKVLEIEAHAQW